METRSSYVQQAHEYYREQIRRVMAAAVPRGLVIKAGTLAALGGAGALSQILAACASAPKESLSGVSAVGTYQYSKYPLIDKYHFRKLPWGGTPYVDGVMQDTFSGYSSWDYVRLNIQIGASSGHIVSRVLDKQWGEGADMYKDALAPGLADRWKPAPDYSYTDYHIRPTAYFHDLPPVNGRRCTAEDVKYCYDVFRTVGPTAEYLQFIDRLEVLADQETLRVHLKRPVLFLDFAMSPTDLNIFAREHYEGSKERWERQPIGTGPFKMVSQTVGSSITLVRHEKFGRTDDRWPGYQLPFIREIRGFALAAGVTSKAALRSGQLDYTTIGDVVELDDLLSTNPELVIQVNPANSNYPPFDYTFQHKDPLFQDVRVRRALNMALDRRKMIDTLTGGNGAASHVISFNWMGLDDPFQPEELGPYQQYDPKRAKELLAEAGYPNGFEMEFLVSGAPDNRSVMIQQMFADVGVRVVFNQVESVVLTSTRLAKSFKHAVVVSSATAFDPIKNVRDYFLPGSNRNEGSIGDPVLTDLIERATYTLDFDEQRRLLVQVHERTLDQCYWLMDYAAHVIHVRQPWVHNGSSGVQGYFSALGRQQFGIVWIDDKAPGDRAGRLKA